jgi:hypothetical protein
LAQHSLSSARQGHAQYQHPSSSWPTGACSFRTLGLLCCCDVQNHLMPLR